MLRLSIDQACQIDLPNSILINNVLHPLRKIDCILSQRYSSSMSLQQDLDYLENSINEYLLSPSKPGDFFRSSTILYRKCFGTSGRKAKIEESDLKKLSSELIDLHRRLFRLANVYTAHADKSEYEYNIPFLVLDPNTKKVLGISTFNAKLQSLLQSDLEKWLELIAVLKTQLKIRSEEFTEKIIANYNKNLD